MAQNPTVPRAVGVTPAERYLNRLGGRTFLSLWSYPGVYRDQGRAGGKGDGKEVADLLVVFEDHVLIFSDKDCAFPDSGDLGRDWSRWYRRAVESSAEQVWGAERWIKAHPDRLFLDRACTRPFPLDLPDPARAKFHRIVVAHGTVERCRRELGGSGSLRIAPDIVGRRHHASPEEGGAPFSIGRIDPARGYVHVLDDASLDIVLTEVDTISDFVAYLTKKEQLILDGRLESATAEEDLLAHYLFPLEGKGESDFTLPPGAQRLSVKEGLWLEFDRDPWRLRKREEDRVSYLWDRIIESSGKHAIAGTAYYATHPGIRGGSGALRLLAREPRTRRRSLVISLRDLITTTRNVPQERVLRVREPTKPEEPYFAFLLLSPDLKSVTEDEYRVFRRESLMGLCEVVKLRFPDAEDIVGIATEKGRAAFRSQDVVYRDAREFTEQDRMEAQRIAERTGFLTNPVRSASTFYDFPHPAAPLQSAPFGWPPFAMKGRDRNSPCPCRSGKKFKRCCGV